METASQRTSSADRRMRTKRQLLCTGDVTRALREESLLEFERPQLCHREGMIVPAEFKGRLSMAHTGLGGPWS